MRKRILERLLLREVMHLGEPGIEWCAYALCGGICCDELWIGFLKCTELLLECIAHGFAYLGFIQNEILVVPLPNLLSEHFDAICCCSFVHCGYCSVAPFSSRMYAPPPRPPPHSNNHKRKNMFYSKI